MKYVQWLLIGGPADGKTVWIMAGRTVRWRHCDGKVYEYRGQTYLRRCRLYRIGFVDARDFEPSKVERLIDESGLQALDTSK